MELDGFGFEGEEQNKPLGGVDFGEFEVNVDPVVDLGITFDQGNVAEVVTFIIDGNSNVIRFGGKFTDGPGASRFLGQNQFETLKELGRKIEEQGPISDEVELSEEARRFRDVMARVYEETKAYRFLCGKWEGADLLALTIEEIEKKYLELMYQNGVEDYEEVKVLIAGLVDGLSEKREEMDMDGFFTEFDSVVSNAFSYFEPNGSIAEALVSGGGNCLAKTLLGALVLLKVCEDEINSGKMEIGINQSVHRSGFDHIGHVNLVVVYDGWLYSFELTSDSKIIACAPFQERDRSNFLSLKRVLSDEDLFKVIMQSFLDPEINRKRREIRNIVTLNLPRPRVPRRNWFGHSQDSSSEEVVDTDDVDSRGLLDDRRHVQLQGCLLALSAFASCVIAPFLVKDAIDLLRSKTVISGVKPVERGSVQYVDLVDFDELDGLPVVDKSAFGMSIDSVIVQYTKDIEQFPDDYELYLRRAWLFFNKKDYTATVLDLDKAIFLMEDDYERFYLMVNKRTVMELMGEDTNKISYEIGEYSLGLDDEQIKKDFKPDIFTLRIVYYLRSNNFLEIDKCLSKLKDSAVGTKYEKEYLDWAGRFEQKYKDELSKVRKSSSEDQ